MSAIGEWLRRVWYLLNRGRLEDELKREMEAHRAMMGAPARFGNSLRLREESREVWGWTWLDDTGRDLRFALRTLRRTPGFALVTVCSLALATGATTAIFTTLHGVVLRPLPFADPDRLVQLFGRNWSEDRGGVPDSLTGRVGFAELYEFRRQSSSFDGLVAYHGTTRHLAGPQGPERVTAVVADRELFAVLGVQAIAGRTFGPDDPLDVAVLSARVWRERFDGDPSLPGRHISLDGRTFTVVGVMPESFQFPYSAASLMPGALPEARTDVWIPLEPVPASASGPPRRGRVSVIGRLKRGVDIQTATTELKVIAGRLEEERPRFRIGVRLEALDEVVVGSVRRSLWMLFAAAGLVLAAACANVANLLLARMTIRTREVVTRAALGAGRSRIVRQFLTESLLLSLAGGLAGVAIASWGTGALVAVSSAGLPRAHEVALDWRAFLFLLTVCVATAVLFGLAPAITAARLDLQTTAGKSGAEAAIRGTFGRLRDGLVMLEVALAFVLALGAALLMREMTRLGNVDAGMARTNVLTMHFTPTAHARDYYAIEDRVAHLPGIRGAGFTQLVPLQNWGWDAEFAVRGRSLEGRPTAGLRYVTPGYFGALGIPLVSGRGFANADTADSPRVILINEALARRYFPGEDPVGRALDRGTIVGVVGNVRQVHLDRPAEPELYYPAAQNLTMASDIGMSLVVRTDGPPEAYAATIRSAVRAVNPNLAIFNVKSMEQVVADSLWNLNLYRWLLGLFAGLALVLAAIGLYGVIAYDAASRTREFAVRLALGSNPAGLGRMVLARAARLAGIGLGGGILTTLALNVAIRNTGLAIAPSPVAYAAVAAVLLGIALVAGVVPALRVSAVNPAVALRHD